MRKLLTILATGILGVAMFATVVSAATVDLQGKFHAQGVGLAHFSGGDVLEGKVGAGVIIVHGDPARLELTANLRRACAPLDDSEIRGGLIDAESIRRGGVTKSDRIRVILDPFGPCDSGPLAVELKCQDCGLALTEQIYSGFGVPEVIEDAGGFRSPLLINRDGLPDSASTFDQVGGFGLRSTIIDVETLPGVIVVKFAVAMDFFDTTTGEVLGTLVGQEIDSYKQVSNTEIEFWANLNLDVQDVAGSATFFREVRGGFGR